MGLLKHRGRWFFPLVLISFLSISAGLLLYSASSRAAHCTPGGTPPCVEDIANTKHNLAANTDILATGTTEVCVFCHTPHGGRTDVAGGSAPLWNRALPPSTVVDPGDTSTVGGFIMYTSPNFDGGTDAATGPKGVSLACLSCHDGVIALDAMINAPGSGGFQAANRNVLTTTSAGTSLTNIGFTGLGVETDESLDEGERPSSTSGGGFLGGLNDFVGPASGEGMEPFPNLGRNLTDDHPISIRMPITDPQFKDALDNSFDTSSGSNPNATAKIVGVTRAGRSLPTDVRDWVRFYETDGTTTDWVECASCHNPHTPRTTFLRLPSLSIAATGTETPVSGATEDLNHEPNQGSLLCLTCHQK